MGIFRERKTGVGKCPNVSHHPTIGDISSPTDMGTYLVWWCETNPKIIGHQPQALKKHGRTFPTCSSFRRRFSSMGFSCSSARKASCWEATCGLSFPDPKDLWTGLVNGVPPDGWFLWRGNIPSSKIWMTRGSPILGKLHIFFGVRWTNDGNFGVKLMEKWWETWWETERWPKAWL